MMKQWIVVSVIGFLGGCATEETKVSCEGRLQPINSSATTADSPPKGAPNERP